MKSTRDELTTINGDLTTINYPSPAMSRETTRCRKKSGCNSEVLLNRHISSAAKNANKFHVRGGHSSALAAGMYDVNSIVDKNDVEQYQHQYQDDDDLSHSGTIWPKGLVNVGNTCYANAALQCLLSTALANALLDPKTVRVFRRYSSNPNILAQGSGSVDSDEEDPLDCSSRSHKGEVRRFEREKRERLEREREEERMQQNCRWLEKELRQITLEYTDPKQQLASSSSSKNNRSHYKLFEWLVGKSDKSSRNAIDPGKITRHPNQISKCLRPYCQEDAHEFLRALLSTLVMNGHNKQMSSLFDGLLESSVTCQTCLRPSLKRDRYMDLSLDINADNTETLTDSLREFTKTELLTGDNKVFCERCKCKQTATKALRLATAPSVLVCHLKRFAFDRHGQLVRLSKHIKFPLKLRIEEFMSRVNQARPPPYELVGVLVHQGNSCDSGHYLAYVKSDQKWFKCNDNVVTQVDVETVLKQQAYILMYEVAEMRSKKNRTISPAVQRYAAKAKKNKSKMTSPARSKSNSPRHRRRKSGGSDHGGGIFSCLCSVDVFDVCFENPSLSNAAATASGLAGNGGVGGKTSYLTNVVGEWSCDEEDYKKSNVGRISTAARFAFDESHSGSREIGENKEDDTSSKNVNKLDSEATEVITPKSTLTPFRRSLSNVNLARNGLLNYSQQSKHQLERQFNSSMRCTSEVGAEDIRRVPRETNGLTRSQFRF